MNIAEAPSSQELNFLAETFRLLGDPSRLKILLHCEDGPKSVTDISEALELSQSLVSHHLRTQGDHQHTYTCQTPDALHAIPHCGLGPVHETGKARPGSRTGYQQAKEKG